MDVSIDYMKRGKLKVYKMARGSAWLDAGTSSSIHDASSYVQTIENRQGIKLGCPEEAAYRKEFISLEQLESLVHNIPRCEYRSYLENIIKEEKNL